MKKILLFIDSIGSGGAQRQLIYLALMLKQKGYDVKLCYYHNFPFYKQFLEDNSIPHEIIKNASSSIKRIPAFAKYIKLEKPDWVISYLETPSLVACCSKILVGNFKLLVSERNTTQHVGWNERVRFFLYRWADFIVPNSYSQTDYLLSSHKWMRKKINTIVNFVDLELFHPVFHRRHKIPQLLVVGAIGESKNTKRFLHACKLLKDKKVIFEVRWFGWKPNPTDYMLEAKEMITSLGLNGIVSFEDKKLNIAPEYNNSDYYIMPSIFEGTPNVLCEAIASGLPVVSSDVCDNHIYTIENMNGFLFDCQSIDEMASAIEQALNLSDEQYADFCHSSRKIAEEKLTAERFLDSYIKIIES